MVGRGGCVEDISSADLGQLYLELHHRFYRLVDEAMVSAGLSLSRAKVLKQLQENGPMKQVTLAATLGLAGRSVTEAVDALERQSLAVRRVDPNDRRVWLVDITSAGATALTNAMAAKTRAMHDIFGALDAPARAELARLLVSLRDRLAHDPGELHAQQ